MRYRVLSTKSAKRKGYFWCFKQGWTTRTVTLQAELSQLDSWLISQLTENESSTTEWTLKSFIKEESLYSLVPAQSVGGFQVYWIVNLISFSFWLLNQHERVDKVTVWELVMGFFFFFFSPNNFPDFTWFKIEKWKQYSAAVLQMNSRHTHNSLQTVLFEDPETVTISILMYLVQTIVIFCCMILAFMCFLGDYKISRYVLCIAV